jgi:hypothetical protein
MKYVTTFSFQSPHEKTELAPTGATVTIAAPVADTDLDSFFRSAPTYAHRGDHLAKLNAGAPRPLNDDFHRFLERAKNT